MGRGWLRTVLTTAQPEDPHFCRGGFVAMLAVLVPLPGVVLFVELPHAEASSATATIAPSAARRRKIKDISKGSFAIGISFAEYAMYSLRLAPARLGRTTEVIPHFGFTEERDGPASEKKA